MPPSNLAAILEVILKQQKNKSEKREFWREQIKSAAKFQGSTAAFCKANNLSINTLNYYRKKFDKEKNPVPVVTKPFVEVTVEKPTMGSRKGFLPDPKWVADFILHLQAGLR
jgi:hypothetical protein